MIVEQCEPNEIAVSKRLLREGHHQHLIADMDD